MKIKKTLVIGLALFLLLPILELPIYRLSAQEVDSTAIGTAFLKWGRIQVIPSTFGVIVRRSAEPNTICESSEFIGAGFNIELMRREKALIWGLGIGMSFYATKDKSFPILTGEIIIMDVLRIAGGFDLGLVENNIQSEWEKRAVLLIGCNLLGLLK